MDYKDKIHPVVRFTWQNVIIKATDEKDYKATLYSDQKN